MVSERRILEMCRIRRQISRLGSVICDVNPNPSLPHFLVRTIAPRPALVSWTPKIIDDHRAYLALVVVVVVSLVNVCLSFTFIPD
jgi:hypothetical protein